MNYQVREIQLSFKGNSNLPIVKNSREVAQIAIEHFGNTIELMEEFKIILLSPNNKIKGIASVASGGLASTLVDLRLLFSIALKGLATGIICVHNHPSGNIKPSKADIELTQKIKDAGELLGIALIDHLIVSKSDGYYSFADELIL